MEIFVCDTFNFIMVLHPKLPLHIVHKWKQIDNSHFTFYDTTDLIPLFKRADIMLSDTTSAIQEFLLQNLQVGLNRLEIARVLFQVSL